MIITQAQIEAICKALNDADTFYDMFDGWEGVAERLENLHLAWKAMEQLDQPID